MPSTKFGYTILYVKAVVQAVEFYERAFGLERRFVHESGQYAELETGETTLAFAANELAASNLTGGDLTGGDLTGGDLAQGFQANSLTGLPAGIEVGLVTSDVPAAFAQAVQAGAVAMVEPKTKPWGQTVAYVRDLDGVLVELCSPIGE